MAVIVANVAGPAEIDAALSQVASSGTGRTTSVVLPDGRVLGANTQGLVNDPDVRRAAARGAAFTVPTADGVAVLVPVVQDSGTIVIRTAVSRAALRQGVAVAWASIAGVGVVLFVISLLIARQLAGRISTPVSQLALVAHRLRAGDVDARVRPDGPEEVREVGTAINLLADRLDDLLAAEREAVADLSHRLRTPITALRLDSEAPWSPETGDRMQGHLDQLQRTVDAVVEEARRPVRTTLRGSSDAVAVVTERVRFWGPLAEDQGRSLSLTAPQHALPVALASKDLCDLVDILLDNVFAHTPEGAGIEVTLGRAPGAVARVVLTVADAGPGFPDQGTAAERGLSGSGSSGLGLDIVRRMARSSGGEATLGRSRAGGAVISVVLGEPH
jgi:signal transduction histidine kinase